MSNRRSIFYLLFLLAVSLGANLLLDLKGTDHGEVVRRKSLVGDADSAVAMEISAYGNMAIRLEKSDIWRIVAPFRASADKTSVLRLADALAFSPIIDHIDPSAALKLGRSREDFGLDAPRVLVRVITPNGETEVSFGDRLVSGEGVYASVSGSQIVYVVPHDVLAAADVPVDSWRRRELFDAMPGEVASLDIRRGDTPPVRIVRNGERWEVVEPRKSAASSAAVTRIVDTVLACKAGKFVWPVGNSNETVSASVSLLTGYGLDPETCDTVTFHTADGRDHSISFGSVSASNSVYALVLGGTAVATVSSDAKATLSLDLGTLVDGRLFPLEKSAVRRISITDGETAYQLALGDNGLWRLDAPVAAAADEKAVGEMIDKLLVMRSSDLDESGVSVSLSTNSLPVSVSRSALLGSDGFEALRSKVVVDLDAATVRRIVVSRAGAELPDSVVFDPDRKGWSVESTGRSGVLDQERLNALLGALDPLKAKAVARLKVSPGELAKYGLENPQCTIAVDRLLEGAVRKNIFLGNVLNLDGDVYATVGTSDAVFILDGETVKTLTTGVLAE